MTAEEIKALRGELGVSQQKFADMLKVSISAVARWETGACKPSPMAQEKLNQIKRR